MKTIQSRHPRLGEYEIVFLMSRPEALIMDYPKCSIIPPLNSFCSACPNRLKRLTSCSGCNVDHVVMEEDGDTIIAHATCKYPYSSYSESDSPSSSPSTSFSSSSGKSSSSGRLTIKDLHRAKHLLTRNFW